MQIKNIQLDRFGACSAVSLDGLTDGVNVIHGPAGSGKATLSRFVRSVLYGFNDSTRRQYLPVESHGYGGSLKLKTLSGVQTVRRTDDGSHDGRLLIESEDGSITQRAQTVQALTAIPESAFDRIFAVDYRRRPGIGALIEEAHSSGLDLLERGFDLEQLSELEIQLRQQRDSLATTPRVQATHDELCNRRVELLRVISELEAALADQPDEDALAGQIKRLEAQLAEWQGELHKLQAAIREAESRRRQILAKRQATPVAKQVDAPQIRALNDLVAQIEGWQQTLREVTTRRQSLEERADKLGLRDITGDPRMCLGEIESQLDDVQSTLIGLNEASNYQGREIRALFTDVFAELRANVYRLCNQLSYWESTAQNAQLTSEAKDLFRCEAELRLAIKGATVRKQLLQKEIEELFGEDGIALTTWNDVHCECAEHPPLTARTVITETRPTYEEELAAIGAEIASLERRQDRIVADVDDIESDLADIRQQLRLADRVELLDQLDAKRSELRRVEQNLRDADRRRELLADIAATEEAIAELRANTRTSELVANASEYLRRLTSGDLRQIEVAANEQVWVIDEHGRRRAYHQLSDGGRDLVYLSLCLTLVEGFKARGIQAPMIISGAFTHVDAKNVPEAAELLRDFATRGHQLFVFTRHEHVASVFGLLNVPVQTLERIPSPTSTSDSDQASTTNTFDAAVDEELAISDELVLSEHSSIEDAPAIDATTAARLRTIGVMRVGDLLRLSAKAAANDLREYGITVEQIVSWKAQTRLVCEVPGLRGYDARILVACGITEPEELYRLSPTELRTLVKDMLASSNGQALLLSGTEFELSRVADWIGTNNPNGRSRFGGNRRSSRHSRSRSNRGERSSDRGDRHASGRSSFDRDRQRSERQSRDENPDVVKIRSSNSDWKFYLGRNDLVVDAPSIGARTAERLGEIGITTVADLLEADAESIAEQLDVKRFTANVITQWQQQTELACRVPQLRGHDAQILVALGIVDVEELASSDPQELWTLVEPFVDTKEGKRIIRNGKTPDLEEVTEWVQWAQASRRLSAA